MSGRTHLMSAVLLPGGQPPGHRPTGETTS